MKIKILLLALVISSVLVSIYYFDASSSNVKKIGIIVPIEHKAMDEIVTGFTETLQKSTAKTLYFKVANAQGDINLERAIIQQMKQEHYDMVVPIGTDATQMTAAIIKNKPIVSLASDFTNQKKNNSNNIAVVQDEIPSEKLMGFIHVVYPDLKNITLIHSASEKVYPEVDAAINSGKHYGIIVKPLLVSSLPDLYAVSNNVPLNTEAVLVLKDSLIISGISTLEKMAVKNQIPLITSDQGSVQDGALFALGVHEREIGVLGASLADSILSGKTANELPMVEMKKLTVFINRTSLVKFKQNIGLIKNAANKFNYKIELVG